MPLALAPAGESANSHALRPFANGRIQVSQSLFEIGMRPSSRMEDGDIIALYLERNQEAIAETEKKYGRYCYAIAYNILYNAEDAEESVNDALMNAWNSIPPHMPSVLSAFLGKLTRYVSLKKWRYARTQKRGGGETALAYEELSDCIPDGKSVEEELQEKELAEIIDCFLDELPAVERHIFICRYWYFDDISTISKQFGFSSSKVKSMLYRIRKNCYPD